MNGANRLSFLLRLNSIFSTGHPRAHWLCNQVIQFSSFFQSPSASFPEQLHIYNLFNTHQKLFFSSKPMPMVKLRLPSDWSKDIQKEIEKLNPNLAHEISIYILRKLDRDPQKALDFFNWVCGRKGFKPNSLLYSSLLRILVGKDWMKQFWVTIREMKEKGFYVDEETYLTILGLLKKERMASDAAALTHFHNRMIQENAMNDAVRNAVEVILGPHWSQGPENKLAELKLPMSENFLLRTFKELRRQPLKALECFRWVGKNLGYKHNSVTYNGIARVLAQRDSIREFWSVVMEMRTQGHEMDIDTYIKISRNFQKCRIMKDAVELYEFMMDGPFEPSDQDCILLLKTISVDPDLDLVFRVVKKYEAAGHTLSKAGYDGIHRSLTSIGRFDEAQKIVEAMENLGYEPDNITYSQVVFGLCKASRFDEACSVLDEMEACGCLPDIKTWTILIKGHCAANQIEKALSCFAKMMGKNLDADADLLDVMINGFLTQKKLHGAYTLLVEMVDKSRLRPWQATYKLLIERLLEVRRLQEALNLLHMMKKHNYPPFAEPFVQYISKYGTVEDAREFLNALSVREYASSAAYLHVLRSFFNEGRHSEATDLFYKSPPHIRTHKEISNLFGSTKNHRTPA